MHHLLLILATFSILALPNTTTHHWGKAYRWGQLDTHLLDEESGMVISRQFDDRIYHLNDSDDGPYFYITDLKGRHTVKVKIEDWSPKDTEDLAIGPCDGETCLYISDIGDNDEERSSVKFAVLKELVDFSTQATPKHIITAKYPDGPHNAEASVFDAEGNLYVITKNENYPALIFRLSHESISRSQGISIFEYWGKIDVPEILSSYKAKVTSATITHDGKTLLLLTKNNLVEAQVDLSAPLEKVKTHVVQLHNLFQQESISFLPDESGFLYSTESDGDVAEIWRVDLELK